ncbi:RrF2 family transcriptional regulator [Roseibium aggregatum]|uniref:Rrf2 family transcriptional regulator n=1 Tax=Roseibium aggregatum TaxID=187304 RepID=A0A926NZH6_9HYPH|nr:Rrf2 family transcriptional regulator [Roseibium aggregatum]MBD1548294.1 Rrf2 family transcriptional regulator [Roseibium aggregatum]
MRLAQKTSVAVKLLALLSSHKNNKYTAEEIADRLKVSRSLVAQVVMELRRNHYVTTKTGKHGGISMLKDPQSISLTEIIQIFEADFALTRCLKHDHDADCIFPNGCPMKEIFTNALDKFFDVLSKATIDDLLDADFTP